MQRIRTIMAVLAFVSVLCTPASFAQQREPLPGQNSGGPADRPGMQEPATPKAVRPEVPPVLKATTSIGSSVMNRQRVSLGKIENLVIDPTTGSITYAALSYGSVLGIGGKLFAVAWKALELQPDGTSFILNLSKEMLESASGFDKNNWPQRPDPVLSATARRTETGASPLPATRAGTGIPAMVQMVNVPAETITLQTEHGENMELRASKAMLEDLQVGDIVKVKMVGAQATEIYKQ